MKNKSKPTGHKNPIIQSMLEHLAKETIFPEKVDLWPALRADLAASKTRLQPKERSMNKRFIFTALAVVLVLSIVAVLAANTVTTVSAQEILNRAYEAQSTQTEGEGIQHMRVEVYHNLCARPEAAVVATTLDSYLDLRTGYFRTVTMETETRNVLEVSSFDGAYVYSGSRSIAVNSEKPEQGTASQRKQTACEQTRGNTEDVMNIYRVPQSSVAGVNLPMSEGQQTYEEIFEKMRNDSNTELLGEETWRDGRTVYVLRSWQPVKVFMEGTLDLPMGWVVSYFDAESYKIVESRATLEQNGEELLVYSYRVMADEVLPTESNVPWDLSDLPGITTVDDTEGQYVKSFPEVMSVEELAKTQSAYLLNSIPEGFTLEISASRKQPVDQPFIYVASYRNESGDYFVIQSIGSKETKLMDEPSGETYTTASGLEITFMEDTKDAAGKQFTSTVVKTPEGTAFIVSSTLPQEQVKALAENLVLASQ